MLPLYLGTMDLALVLTFGVQVPYPLNCLPSSKLLMICLGKLYSKNGNTYAHYLFRYVQTGQMARLYFLSRSLHL